MGVDVKWLLKSPLAEGLRKEVKGNLGDLAPLELLIEQIDTVHLAAAAKSGKVSDLLLLVQGRFEADQLVQLALKNGFRADQWGKIKVLLPAKEPQRRALPRKAEFKKAQFQMEMPQTKPGFAFLDSRRIVVGEEGPLRVALERLETGLVPQANPLFERARDMEAAHDVWIVGSTAPLNLNTAQGKGSDPMAQLAGQIRNFAMGVAVRRNITMDLSLQTTSTKAAAQMLDLAKGAMAMAKMAPNPEGAPALDFDKMVQLSATGNLVKASVTMEQADVDRLMAGVVKGNSKLKQPTAPQAADQPVAAPTVSVAKPAEPVRKTVMIYGLPGGPKEVPVQ